MDEAYISTFTEEERAQRHEQRRAARLARQRAKRRRMLFIALPVVILAAALIAVLIHLGQKDRQPAQSDPVEPVAEEITPQPEVYQPLVVKSSPDAVTLGDELSSRYAVLLNADTGEIIAEKDADVRINPASMTKILTLLVAAEHIENLDDTVSIDADITYYTFINEMSMVGFELEEQPTVKDLLYGTILPSGADAALGLAKYVSGSHEAFVELMNEKLEELGIADTAHFTNCVGAYDENHYCTVSDMAVMLKAAVDNELCRQILSEHCYTTVPTPEHPEGLEVSNWFLRRIEDKDSGCVTVDYAKTGYVKEAGSCAASCGSDGLGNVYLCVTADAGGSWPCIYDHALIYKTYCN